MSSVVQLFQFPIYELSGRVVQMFLSLLLFFNFSAAFQFSSLDSVFKDPSPLTLCLLMVPRHSPYWIYSNCAWYKEPPSWMVAVIDGAVKDNFSAIICCILLASSVFNIWGVSASILAWQSGEPASSHEPASAIASNFLSPEALSPPP